MTSCFFEVTVVDSSEPWKRWIPLCPVLSHQWSGACHKLCRAGQHDSHFIGPSHSSDIVSAPAHDRWMAQISCYCPGARDKSPFCLFILEFFCHIRLSQYNVCCYSKAGKPLYPFSLHALLLNMTDILILDHLSNCICNLKLHVGAHMETSANSLTISSVPSLEEWVENWVDHRPILRFIRCPQF